jgi:hypothetical protein
MKLRLRIGLVILVVLPGLAACNLPSVQPTTSTVAPGEIQPPAAVDTNTPEFSPTPSDTPLPTLTFTPEVPMVSVSVDTNCRSGPGTAYDILGVLHVGETAEVVGVAPYGGSWIIKNPDGAGTCWLWDQYASVTGSTAGLPTIDVPPTPTPTASFTVSYLNMVTCGAWFGFRFNLTNNGSVTWESYRVDVYDSVTLVTRTFTDDKYTDSTPACIATTVLQDLAPGEVGNTGNWAAGLFNYNPLAHAMTATFTLCSENGLGGQCISKSVSFTP